MNRGHMDAQNYRFDFVDAIIDEMSGVKPKAKDETDDNDEKMKRLFDGE